MSGYRRPLHMEPLRKGDGYFLCEHSDVLPIHSHCVFQPGELAITVNDGNGHETEDMVPLTVLSPFFFGRHSPPLLIEDIANLELQRHSKVAFMATYIVEGASHAADCVPRHTRRTRASRFLQKILSPR